MNPLKKKQRDFLEKINCNDLGKKVDEIVNYINSKEKEEENDTSITWDSWESNIKQAQDDSDEYNKRVGEKIEDFYGKYLVGDKDELLDFVRWLEWYTRQDERKRIISMINFYK